MKNLRYSTNDCDAWEVFIEALSEAAIGEHLVIDGTEVVVRRDTPEHCEWVNCKKCKFYGDCALFIPCFGAARKDGTPVYFEVVKPEITENAKKMVANEIINMLYNNVVEECGAESFDAWIEGGALYCSDYEGWEHLTSPLTEKDIEAALKLSSDLNDLVTNLAKKIEEAGL